MSVASTLHQPTVHPDGTLGGVLLEKMQIGAAGTLLHFQLPAPPPPDTGGRFYLARCTPDTVADRLAEWSIYPRCPLFTAGTPTPGTPELTLLLPGGDDPGARWLDRQPVGTRVNLLGPLGQTVELPAAARTLLLVGTPALVPLLLPFAHAMLDRGGRVTLYIQTAPPTGPLRQLIPLAVEIHQLPAPPQWESELQTGLRWADHVVAALDLDRYVTLAQAIRRARFRLEPGYAHALAAPNLICGYGACLACVVPTTDGSLTRACIHGPFFPLEQLVR